MILCIDAGNTRIKWGIAEAAMGPWLATDALPTAVPSGLAVHLARFDGLRAAWACSVAGDRVEAALERVLRARGIAVTWLRPAAAAFGVRNGYRDPAQLGADRWAALIGARGLHDGPAVVVMAGTATTIDLLEADGRFAGGLILPGFELMRGALARGTAQLPLAQAWPPAELPQSTDEAIVSGCLAAQVGAIERMFRRIAAQPNARCLLSGGGAMALLGLLEVPFLCVDNLALEGLRRVAFAPAMDGSK